MKGKYGEEQWETWRGPGVETDMEDFETIQRRKEMTHCAYPKKVWGDTSCTFSNGSTMP